MWRVFREWIKEFLMGLNIAIPESKDIQELISIEKQRLEVEQGILEVLGAKPRVFFDTITFNGVKTTGEFTMAELREGQQIVASATFKTAAGNPAAYEKGSAKWVSSDPTIASVDVDPNNELSATVKGLNGAANTPVLVTFTADGDPDADQTRDLVATLDIVVTQGEAVVTEIVPGPATDIPPTP
jgi:hypothetical protein